MSDEPEFFRLFSRKINSWVKIYRETSGGSFITGWCALERDAMIFTNAAVNLDTIRRRVLSDVETRPATYAEWIEQDPARKL